jgi:uncharacterized protein GlcG (DUF336 family)
MTITRTFESSQETHQLKKLGQSTLIVALGCTVAWIATAANNSDQPAGPRSLPGDNLPPFGMLDESSRLPAYPPAPPGGFHHGGPGTPVESEARGPTMDMAIDAARAAIKNCESRGYQGAATVIDSAGQARAMISANGSDGSHVFVAYRKALTALEFKMPSAQARETVPSSPELLARVKPNMFVQFGAYPILQGKEVIGAIGYSGGDDVTCAKAGLDRIEHLLKAHRA